MKSVFSERQLQPAADNPASQFRTTTIEWLTAVALFAATALVVIWQNAHVAVLWDLSYVLENAHRIALGDVPYRDFPFVYPPLTFLIQSAIIKFTGGVFWHHVLYCAVTGGVGTILTWRIMRRVVSGTREAKLLALVLTLPLVPLGIYSVFPHPFYDPDCSLVLLISLLILLNLDRRPGSVLLPILAGIFVAVPVFVKQNTGLAYLLASLCLVAALTIWERLNHRPVRHYLIVIGSTLLTVVILLGLIHRIAGLENYWHWTIKFAAERRTPARGEMLEIYTDKMNLIWFGLIIGGMVVIWFNRKKNRLLLWLALILLAIPFLWPALYLLWESDASERAERLINVWPVLLVVSFISAIVTLHHRTGIARILPFTIIAAIHGCFMSQQLWGSTYAIWPLFMVLVAMTLTDFSSFSRLKAEVLPASQRSKVNWLLLSLSMSVGFSLLIAGAFYVRSHERLSYANLDDGALKRSALPQLKGLSTRGDWLPNFEELVRYSNTTIPEGDGILLLPGEDPFYYTTGRRPQFPVLLFDHTVNPYSPEEIRAICRERNINWLVVKQDLQNEEDAVDQEKERITSALEDDFEQVESLTNYDIYRRIDPNVKKDTGDDDDDDER